MRVRVPPALPISRGLMAGQRTVNPKCGGSTPPARARGLSSGGKSAGPSTRRPRVQVPQIPLRARIAQQQSTRTTTWRGTFGSCCGCSAPVVKRTSRLTTNQETGGSSPSGSAQARLAQWESTWSTPRGRRSDSFAEHGGYSSIGRAPGGDPGGCQFDPG